MGQLTKAQAQILYYVMLEQRGLNWADPDDVKHCEAMGWILHETLAPGFGVVYQTTEAGFTALGEYEEAK